MQRKIIELMFQAKKPPNFGFSISFPLALSLIFYNITCLCDKNTNLGLYLIFFQLTD